MKPLIKYTGGKYSEYENIKDMLPNIIENYHEPFVGGGGTMFQLYNNNKVNGDYYINDISQDLIRFYRNITNTNMHQEIFKLSEAWDKIKEISNHLAIFFKDSCKNAILSKDLSLFESERCKNYISDALDEFITYNTYGIDYKKIIFKYLFDKIKRAVNKDIPPQEIDSFTDNTLKTAFCQSWYFFVRELYNRELSNNGVFSDEEKTAHWLFVREFCYGGMFRFNNGKFNIPYGGKSYNAKCFSCKCNEIVNEETQFLFNKMHIYNMDFENYIKQVTLNKNDFMYLDPPYDTTFSEYDQNEFNRNDQVRLRDILKNIKCKWMVVIQDNEFIRDLYKDFNILSYNKTYMYRTRGEYNNKVQHLVIRNYE